MMHLWFSRVQSATEMVAGKKNEPAVLEACLQHDQAADIWECGLFEAKDCSWLAAAPNAIALLQLEENFQLILAPVEIKTKGRNHCCEAQHIICPMLCG
jgi:hypothetical protein